MAIITLDFETYYSKTYSLSKLTTEEYVNGDEFEVIGVGVKVDGAATSWHTGSKEEIGQALQGYNLPNNTLLCHNTYFDATILYEFFGITAKKNLDTLSMARAIHGISVGGSLAKLVEHYELGVKGTEVVNALGKHTKDFSPEELTRYGEYCVNDVELTYDLFFKLLPQFNAQELTLVDITIKMAVKPTLVVDLPMLESYMYEVREKKEALLSTIDADKSEIMSNPKFAVLLERLGVQPPMKVSPTTGKLTYAFAKTDEGLKTLLEHADPTVQALVGARLGVKSTIEETRTDRLIGIAKRTDYLPIPLNYYGAATGRWSAGGGQKVNFQNIPRNSTLKKVIVAPEGYVVVGADLSNIELRVGLWVCGEMEALKSLGEGRDLYKEFASLVFNVAYEDVSKDQRFIGKTCLAEGTLVLCESGWKPIEEVATNDRVWDGEEWVCHLGLVTNGLKETLEICGIWLTPDHLVWSGQKWIQAGQVGLTGCDLSQVLEAGSEKLPLQGMYWGQEEGSKPSSLSAIVSSPSTLWTSTTLKSLKLLDALSVRVKRELRKGIGITSAVCQTMTTGLGCSTGYVQQSQDATYHPASHTDHTEQEGLLYGVSGARTRGSSLDTCKLWRGGTPQNTTWTGRTTTGGTSQKTLGSSQGATTIETNGESTIWKRRLPVYDLNSVGTRNRFTVLTDRGPIIVHNCQLGLIFGVGAGKLRDAIKVGSGTDIGEMEAKRIVGLYRATYKGVTAFWKTCTNAITAMGNDEEFTFGQDGLYVAEGKRGVKFPSGLYMRYPLLANVVDEKTGERGYKYKMRNGYDRLYGGKLTNNLVQGTARCVMSEAMVRIADKYQIALTVHDALYIVVPEAEAQEALDYLIEEMCKPPLWMPDIPLAAEGGWGRSIADC
jgi:DNA polymerase I-like protein with 3'-5' exonuclease and polymerase domains